MSELKCSRSKLFAHFFVFGGKSQKFRIINKYWNEYVRENLRKRAGHKCNMVYCYGLVSSGERGLLMAYTAKPKRRNGVVIEPEMKKYLDTVSMEPTNWHFVQQLRVITY